MGCPFANALGKPGEGVHALRFAGFAVNDTLMTVIVAVLTAKAYHINFFLSFFLWFLLGEILHYVFCVDTAFLRLFKRKIEGTDPS
jgi:hypothetical protein